MSAGPVGLWAGVLLLVQGLVAVMLRRRLRPHRAGLGLAAQLALSLALAGGLGLVVMDHAGLSLDQVGADFWAWIVLSAIGIGYGLSRRARRLPSWELGLAVLALTQLACLAALGFCADQGLAAPVWRALLVAPAAWMACTYFGASIGFLSANDGRAAWRLGYALLIGRRFLLSKSSAVISTVTTISVVGVSLGVWLVLVSLGILAGFENDLQRKIIGANAHLVLQDRGGQPFAAPPDLAARVGQTPGVAAAAAFVEAEVAAASGSNYTGALLFGIDALAAPEVLTVLQQLQAGSLAPLQQPLGGAVAVPTDDIAFAPPQPLPGVVIGAEMAKMLNVQVGAQIRLISPNLEVLTPLGAAPKSLGFRVAAIFSSKMYEYDARHIYVSLAAAQEFLALGAQEISGLQLRCQDPEQSHAVGVAARAQAGLPKLVALDWKERHQTLFSALKLERVVAFVVLVFIILVASFSIVNTLTMSVLEKEREIAILKTMGAHDSGIMKIFLVQGLLIGGFGTLMGAVAGIGSMKLLEHFGFWIPGDVYYIDSLPVRLHGGDVVLVLLAAFLIVWDFAVFPALRGAGVEPAWGLRDG